MSSERKHHQHKMEPSRDAERKGGHEVVCVRVIDTHQTRLPLYKPQAAKKLLLLERPDAVPGKTEIRMRDNSRSLS